MTERNYEVTKEDGAAPVKSWTRGVQFEDEARAQVQRLARMPFIHKHVAVMPDVHGGIGSTIGSVIATKGAIIPAAVGVDIGCGVMAVRTSLLAKDLPDNLASMRSAIEAAVPHGRTDNGGANDRGAWHDVPLSVGAAWYSMKDGYANLIDDHPKIAHHRPAQQLGSLGTGNHFIEVCLDEDQSVWVMLHSGSRGVGNKIGMYFIEKAKSEMKRWFINLPDEDLAYLPEGSDFFGDYMRAVEWAQDYALHNRELMMAATLQALASHTTAFQIGDHAVNCHHNYVSRESHFGENVLVTRKGAVRARSGDFGIIPGSMGAKSFIVRGKGNVESFQSCSHGAGRAMSRTEAKKRFTLTDHAAAMIGVEARLDADVIDETPAAYKSIDLVMEAQRDLVEVIHTLRQVLCVKG